MNERTNDMNAPRFRLHLDDLSFFFHAFLHIPFFKFIPIPSTFRPEFSFHGILHSTFSLCFVDLFAPLSHRLFSRINSFPNRLRFDFEVRSSLYFISFFLFTPAIYWLHLTWLSSDYAPSSLLIFFIQPLHITCIHSMYNVYTIFIFSIFLPMDGIIVCSLR